MRPRPARGGLALFLPLFLGTALALVSVCQREQAAQPPRGVVISEIMYHAVGDDDGPEENHEFIELANRGPEAVPLAGFRIAGGITFTFPGGASVPGNGFVVIAKNRERLTSDVPQYRLAAGTVFGNYEGSLDNDKDQLVLFDASGAKVDEVHYEDSFPWPTGADALGASDDWLPAALLPLDRHRWQGRSLERIRLERPPTVENWAASPLDGATPGRANTGREAAGVVVALRAVAGKPGAEHITAADEVVVSAQVSGGALPAPQLEYFVEEVEQEDEPRQSVPLTRRQGDTGSAQLEARLPAQPAGSIVRYRVLVDRGQGPEVVAPREGDPFGFFGYFVSPEGDLTSKTPVYQLFLRQADWTRLWDAIAPGRVPGNGNGTNPFACELNESWNERVPAVLAVGSEVYDVRVRYQGSFQQRRGAVALMPEQWPATAPRPDRPAGGPRAFSWSIKFPRYRRLDGKRSFTLSKLGQGCHGFNTLIGDTLFERAGIPAARAQYARLFVGGFYFHYMQRIEHMDEDFIRRAFGKGPQGDLFKSVGGRWDEGPYGYSDERSLGEYCGYSIPERYEHNYQRMTNTWKSGGAEMRKLIEDLEAARAAGLPAIRTFFEETFDLPALTTYLAIINWMVAWDDQYHNHYLYRRPADGRWMMFPTDLDNVMGGSPPSTHDASFFVGQWNVRSNRNDYWNQLKDAFLRAFREEFLARVKELDRTVLHPDAVSDLADELAAQYQPEEAMASPAGVSCGSSRDGLNRLKDFAYGRSARIAAGLFD